MNTRMLKALIDVAQVPSTTHTSEVIWPDNVNIRDGDDPNLLRNELKDWSEEFIHTALIDNAEYLNDGSNAADLSIAMPAS